MRPLPVYTPPILLIYELFMTRTIDTKNITTCIYKSLSILSLQSGLVVNNRSSFLQEALIHSQELTISHRIILHTIPSIHQSLHYIACLSREKKRKEPVRTPHFHFLLVDRRIRNNPLCQATSLLHRLLRHYKTILVQL